MAKLVGGGDDTSGDTVDNRRGKTFQRGEDRLNSGSGSRYADVRFRQK